MNRSHPEDQKPARSPVKDYQVSRRTFLKNVAALAALTGLPSWFVERQMLNAAEVPAVPSPNDRPGIALVGCGGMGRYDSTLAAKFGDIIAVCDLDDTRAAAAATQFTVDGKAPAIYSDYRRLLERKDVHVIVNATADHWHSLVNIGAARAGKDIYGEKPLTLTIDEGRHVVDAVRKHKTVLQTGTQQRSNARFRLACELVRNGRLGKLKQAEVFLPAGPREGPFLTSPVPAGLNWDFWQGQTPKVDYVKQRCHGTFRYWHAYSGGTMTDWGAHHNDIAYWGIGLVAPREVQAQHLSEPIPGGYTAFADYEVQYTYANGIGLHIHSTKDDSLSGEKVHPEGQHNGIRFEGSGGWIWVNRQEITASDPDLLTAPLGADAVRLPVSNDHMGNFFDCVRSRQDPICNVETGHRSATMCHLGVIALRTGRKLTWDSDKEKFVGDNRREANHYVSREMRKPYDYSFNG
jgi:predicted dehydrogenase